MKVPHYLYFPKRFSFFSFSFFPPNLSCVNPIGLVLSFIEVGQQNSILFTETYKVLVALYIKYSPVGDAIFSNRSRLKETLFPYECEILIMHTI